MKRTLICLFVLLLVCCAGSAWAESVLFYEEDAVVYDVASYQGALYILRDEGVFRYDVDSKTELLITDNLSAPWDDSARADHLVAEGSILYALSLDNQGIWPLLADGSLTNGDPVVQWNIETYPSAAVLQQGTLYLLLTDINGQSIMGITLADGHTESIDVKNVTHIASAQDGQLLLSTLRSVNGTQSYTLSLLTLSTGETTVLTSLDFAASAIAYDAATDTAYLMNRQQLYAWTADEGLTPCSATVSGDLINIALFGDGYYAALVDNVVGIRLIAPEQPQSTLTVQGYGRAEDYKTFISANPDTTLVFSANQGVTAEERFVNDILTRSTDVDVFTLSDVALLQQIMQKQYGVNLTASDALQAVADDLYTPFQSLFHPSDGVMFALPQKLYVTLLGCNESFLEQFGFATPSTYAELLSLYLTWMADYADDYPEICFNPMANNVSLYTILSAYVDECALRGEPADMTNEALVHTVDLYLQAVEAAASASQGSYDMYVLNVMDAPYSGSYTLLPLSVQADSTPAFGLANIEMTYYVINPYTKHTEEALRFVESAVNDWSAEVQIVLLRSQAAPLENPDYALEKAELQAEIDALEQQQMDATAELNDLEADLAELQEALATCEEYRWDITPHDIAWYQTAVDQIKLNPDNPLPTLWSSQASAVQQLMDGKITTQEFLHQLSQRMEQVRQENDTN